MVLMKLPEWKTVSFPTSCNNIGLWIAVGWGCEWKSGSRVVTRETKKTCRLFLLRAKQSPEGY